MIKPLLLFAAVLAVAGCESGPSAPATVEAECRLIDAPPHVIKATTRSGQFWVDKIVEAAVEVCGHPRPKMWEDVQLGSGHFASEPERRRVPHRPDPAGFSVRLRR